jgi:hypothetical protein
VKSRHCQLFDAHEGLIGQFLQHDSDDVCSYTQESHCLEREVLVAPGTMD